MKKFMEKYNGDIYGVLNCIDRLIIKGHNSFSGAKIMEDFLRRRGILLKDFGKYAKRISTDIVGRAKCLSKQKGVPYIYVENCNTDKKTLVETVIEKNGL